MYTSTGLLKALFWKPEEFGPKTSNSPREWAHQQGPTKANQNNLESQPSQPWVLISASKIDIRKYKAIDDLMKDEIPCTQDYLFYGEAPCQKPKKQIEVHNQNFMKCRTEQSK